MGVMFGRKKPEPPPQWQEDVSIAALVKPPVPTETEYYNWHNDAIWQVQCYLYGKALASIGAERTQYLLLRAELEAFRITVENLGGATDEPLDFDASGLEGEENQ